MVDLTPFLLKAAQQDTNWSKNNLLHTLNQVVQTVPGAIIDWDEGAGEDWASILGPNRVLAIVRVDIPLAIIGTEMTRIKDIFERQAVVVICAADWQASEYGIDISALEKQLPGWNWPSEITSPSGSQSISIQDLWWATI